MNSKALFGTAVAPTIDAAVLLVQPALSGTRNEVLEGKYNSSVAISPKGGRCQGVIHG